MYLGYMPRCSQSSLDHPVEKMTTETKVLAPPGMQAISNGKLLGVSDDPEGRGKVYHWLQDKPHTTYLIAIVVGEFVEYREKWKNIDIVSLVPKEHEENAARSSCSV